MASTRIYEDICEMLKHELDTISRKGDINRDSLDDVYKLTSAMTMLKSLMKQENEQSYGYSNGSYDMSNDVSYESYESNARRGRDGDGDGRYSEDSYRRGRSPMTGRYVSRDSYNRGYSRHTAKERMIVKLEEMMDTTPDEHDRQAIMQCLDKLES